jgi:hypothetical protein
MIRLWTRSWDTGAWYADAPNVPQRRCQQPDERGNRNYLLDV